MSRERSGTRQRQQEHGKDVERTKEHTGQGSEGAAAAASQQVQQELDVDIQLDQGARDCPTLAPLQRAWSYWITPASSDSSRSQGEAQKSTTLIARRVDSVAKFWGLHPTMLAWSDYECISLMDSRTKPEWEDPAHVGGCRWMWSMKWEPEAKTAWNLAVMAAIGEMAVPDERPDVVLLGVELQKSPYGLRIKLWFNKGAINDTDIPPIANDLFRALEKNKSKNAVMSPNLTSAQSAQSSKRAHASQPQHQAPDRTSLTKEVAGRGNHSFVRRGSAAGRGREQRRSR